ncbi:hypothetical protein [Mycolicibacterium palauense]|uniref:hypothetical protein n=1 Tax=Mycolicibacterium palauense TaxID=2034511 RepID=UPI000BFEE674|nr:hypothetical protein [Mycolicibacterium palauense]
MRSKRRYLMWGLATAALPAVTVLAAPQAAGSSDCNTSAETTVCAQGEVRGSDGVPRAASPAVPYPCEYDWYCDTGWDLNVGWNPPWPGVGPR